MESKYYYLGDRLLYSNYNNVLCNIVPSSEPSRRRVRHGGKKVILHGVGNLLLLLSVGRKDDPPTEEQSC